MTHSKIIYFKHCNKYIFSENCPSKCPLCSEYLHSIEPIRLTYPFSRAEEFPAAVLIKPTNGDFLQYNTYAETSDLHIAVTTSAGCIVEYDASGLRRSDASDTSSSWLQCINVFQAEEIWHEQWDYELNQYFLTSDWTQDSYNELSNNCFTFVLSFLKRLRHPQTLRFSDDKNVFCAKMILPKTKAALKYISVYRKLQVHPFYY